MQCACGNKSNLEDQYCSVCGKAQLSYTGGGKIASICSCGEENNSAFSYCGQCGKDLVDATTTGSGLRLGDIKNAISNSAGGVNNFSTNSMQGSRNKWIGATICLLLLISMPIYYYFFSDTAVVTKQTKQILETLLNGKDIKIQGNRFNSDITKQNIFIIAEKIGMPIVKTGTSMEKFKDTEAGLMARNLYLSAEEAQKISKHFDVKYDYSIEEVKIEDGKYALVYSKNVLIKGPKTPPDLMIPFEPTTKIAKWYWTKQDGKWQLSSRTFKEN